MKDMEEEQSFFHLIEYLESYLLELGLELYGATRCQDSFLELLRCEFMHNVCFNCPEGASYR